MAITWGSWESGSDSGNKYRVGIELSIVSTDNVRAEYYAQAEYSSNDEQTSTRSGFITGSTTFNHNSSGGAVKITTIDKDGTPGSTYTLGHTLSGVYSGATPSVSDSIKVPANTPGAPSWVSGTPSGVTSSKATLDWAAPSDNGGASIDRYHLQVDDSSGFGSPNEDDTDAGGAKTVTGLSAGTTYYARVRAHNSEGYGPWSSTKSFKTSVDTPSAPVWVSGTPTNITQTSAFFDWTAPTNDGGGSIDAYRLGVYLNSSGTGATAYYNDSAGGSDTATGLDPNTTYYASTRAHNSAGWGDTSSVRSFKTAPGVPDKVATPTIKDLQATQATVDWVAPANNGASIDEYQVQLDDNTAWSSPNTKSTTDTEWTYPGMTRAKTYYARVRAHNSAGWGPWSGTKSFTTLSTIPSAPSAPTISNITSTSAVASWTAPSDNGGSPITAYDVQYALDSSFTLGLKTQATGTLTGLQSGMNYWVRVRAKNDAGNGAWSPSTQFMTTAPGMRVWNGTAWNPAPVLVWNGTAWVASEVLVFNGTAWVAAV